MNCLSIVSSPLQLLNFNEFLNEHKINNYYLIVMVHNDNEYERINYLLDYYNILSYRIIRAKFLLQYFTLFKIIKNFKRIKKLVIGNFFSDPHLFIVNKLAYEDLIVLDDGMNTSLIPKHIETKERILKSSHFRNLIFSLLNIDVSYPDKINLFTFFKNIRSDKIHILNNNLESVREKIKNMQIKNQVYIIGQPFVELGMLGRQEYFENLKKLKLKYNDLVYIPSRKESKLKIDEIKNKLGYKITYPKINIEMYFIINNFLPKKVYSFTSTALIILRILFSNHPLITINSIFIRNFTGRFKPSVTDKYYRTLKDYKINVVELS